MNKLTNTSPFLLLLVPVFIMMIMSLTTSLNNISGTEAMIKADSSTTIAKVPVQQIK